MQLTQKDLELIATVSVASKRAKLVRAMLFMCVLLCIAAYYAGMLSIDHLAYCLIVIVLVAVFAPNGSLRLDEIAELLERIKSEADGPKPDELIEALRKK